MPRVTHVKKAQQRYETVPVLGEDGQPVKTPVMKNVKNYDTGEVEQVQKTTKKGRPVFMTKTVADKSKPLPELSCDFPGCQINGGKIAVGTPYKHITPKSGPYGGRQRNRHAQHPTWKVWEYSSSLSARIAQIEHDATEAVESLTEDDAQSVLDSAAEEIKALAEEKREGASNIEEGFGHSTSASEELEQTADSLDEWADEIEGTDLPDFPEPEPADCDDCEGTGWIETAEVQNGEASEQEECDNCSGTGKVDSDEPSEEQLSEWRDEVSSAVSDAFGNCPV